MAFSTPTPTPSLSYDATILNPPELTLDQNQISASDDNDNMNFVIDVPDNLPENNDDDLGAM